MNGAGWAHTCPYIGWIEAEHLLRPYLQASAAGLGFGLYLWGAAMLGRWLQRRPA